MKAVLIYDIPDDRARAKIADVCLDYALQRIQYSAFFGDLSGSRLEELLQKIAFVLGKKPGDVQVFPICDKDLKLRRDLTRLRLKREKGSS